MQATIEPINNLLNNIRIMDTSCDWGIVFYSGDDDKITELCKNKIIKN